MKLFICFYINLNDECTFGKICGDKAGRAHRISLTASSLPLTSNEEITTSLGFLTEKIMSEPM